MQQLHRRIHRGHVMRGVEPLYNTPTTKRCNEGPLREIVWARVLVPCGDSDELGRRILEEYRHADAVLDRVVGFACYNCRAW